MKTYAILSDIHGNAWALEAVLTDIRLRSIEYIINLGDTLYGPLAPQATADMLMELPLASIQGNQDRVLFETHPQGHNPTLDFVRSALGTRSLDWLSSQPDSLIIDEKIFICHGTPASDTEYLLENKSPNGGTLRQDNLIRKTLASIPQVIILCGHSHMPRLVWLSDGRLVLNPGSAGLPAYSDGPPDAHKMESGSPHARYAILSETPGGWTAEQVMLSYPWEKAAQTARRNGREDWAAWLRSGRA